MGITINEQRVKDMQECIDRSNNFFEDILPQMDKLVLQDYRNLNELGMLLSRLATKRRDG